ncbi:MAG: PQQ-like beta-propeller repeat protein [Planctomycetaceae bacterium]|nr:PQQ-like beta-propeller repeat protein [Planctomycetaceae bacterium]
MLRIIALLCGLLLAVSTASAENWPSWRGPHYNGVSSEKDVPTEWSSDKNVAWKVALPGPAGSTPVVWGDHIFLTTMDNSGDGKDAYLMALNTEGEELWRHKLGSGQNKARGDEGNNPAAPSPVTDGKHVWAFIGTGDLYCFDFNGKVIWKTNLQDRYGKFDIQFGFTSTPVLVDNKLIFQLIHGKWNKEPQPAWVVALEKTTGKELWKHLRKSDAYAENVHSYASPVLYEDEDQKYLLTHGADYVIAHDLETGKELWRCGGLNPKDNYNEYLRLVASPATAPGIIVVPSAKRGPVLALKPDGQGNITSEVSHYHWKRDRDTPDVPSPLIVDGIVYLCRENGDLIAMDAETGEELYYERVHRVRHRASPVYADGHIYLAGRDGKVSVIKAGPKFELVAQNDTGEEMASSVVIADGRIYLRTFDSLWAIEN